jgi:hypothetical protein
MSDESQIDSYICQLNEKQAANYAYNHPIHPQRQSTGLVAGLIGYLLGMIVTSRKS